MRNVLIITSSGGGGLIQTANAKQQEILAQDPSTRIIRCDILQDWIWAGVGKYGINQWNRAQRKGDVSTLRWIINWQLFADYLFWPAIFLQSLRILFREEIDQVIDTQPMGTSAILKALRLFNRIKHKTVKLEKVVVDLPTAEATHFFGPVKKLSFRDRKTLQLTTIPPLLAPGETEEAFWQCNCNINPSEIRFEEFYVRQSFLQYRDKKQSSLPTSIHIRVKNDEELSLIQRSVQRGALQTRHRTFSRAIEFFIEPQDYLVTILLGSQPANDATFRYVERFFHATQQDPYSASTSLLHLFVFCADHQQGEESLLRKISHWVSLQTHYPTRLSIIPISFQEDDVIAALFARSNLTCTRCGGQTAMELMCVSSGEVWIHSEAKCDPITGAPPTRKALLAGIPGWESGNARYLETKLNAKIITPMTCDVTSILLKTSSLQGKEALELSPPAASVR